MEWENSYLHISPCFFVILTIYVLNDVLTDSLALIFPFFLLMIDVLKIQITMEVKKVLFKNIF